MSTIIFLPAGFFMTGTSARLPVGTPVKGFIDEDVPLAMAAATPLPMTLNSPVPAVTSVVTPVVAAQAPKPVIK